MNKNHDFANASFKNYENPPGMNLYEKARLFGDYIDNWQGRGHWNYRQVCLNGALPEIELHLPGNPHKSFVATVFNDYLGLSQHPAVKAAAIAGIEKYGVGATASPAIGGQMDFHEEIEARIAGFFKRKSAMLFTTGYTANSATMQALFKKEDLALVDAGVHASMIEGIRYTTNVKTFLHNNMEHLERMLLGSQGKYRSIVVIVDGVYSQPADLAPLKDIVSLCKKYGAFLAMDDAHGIGVIGETGRGVIELHEAWKDVDIITGTFSKTFGHLGGYVVAEPEIIEYLKFQAAQHIFSVAPSPASLCVLKSIDLIDEEPWRKVKLWENIDHLKKGLADLKLNTENSASAIVPVIIGSPGLNAEVCKWLLEAGVYANQIGYPAVSLKQARIRMSITAAHSIEHMDLILDAWEWVTTKLKIRNFE
ncbi:glycine C-acetyltransferase [Pedobacter sp. AK017]|uniref:aminotransferase class I/II-fold pyridoxal phosphate-dependent enzyme n=1 Tax=Pedobacter sp. AK017 TaxID=2723073 RepID=UPI00160ACC0D|nr:aminotransferase class I/II-fold pyridoxal phosphate-dependent enzyme [Pedobacter sp. AK017]MBB5440248.1 glycine C-acetyltransferase [Pedobacter sp. AK017]